MVKNSRIRLKASWWQPSDVNNSFVGELVIDGGRPKLTIKAPQFGQGSLHMLAHSETLYGITPDGEHITLWDPFDQPILKDTSGSDSPWMKLPRYFTHAILGAHIPARSEATWVEVTVSFKGMAEWTRTTTPTTAGTPDEHLPGQQEAVVSLPASDATARISITHAQRIETDEQYPHGVTRKHTGDDARWRVLFSKAVPAEVAEQVVADLQAFTTFAYQSSALYSSESARMTEDGPQLTVHARHSTAAANTATPQWHRMLLLLDDIDLSVVLPHWFELIDDAFPVLQVLNVRFNSKARVVESSTSSALAAAERLHELVGSTQQRFESELLATNQKKLLRAIPGDENKDFRQFVREVTRIVRPTLTTKLGELFSTLDQAAVTALGVKRDQWISEAKAVRNSLAHTGAHVAKRGKEEATSLDRVEVQTRAILSLVVLELLGVPKSAVERAAQVLNTEMTVWQEY